jgi:hypothetical protein
MFLKLNMITHYPGRENGAGIRNKARLWVSLLYGLKFSVSISKSWELDSVLFEKKKTKGILDEKC